MSSETLSENKLSTISSLKASNDVDLARSTSLLAFRLDIVDSLFSLNVSEDMKI